jgi:hypothetical protein
MEVSSSQLVDDCAHALETLGPPDEMHDPTVLVEEFLLGLLRVVGHYDYFDADFRSPRSPWPRGASCLAFLRRSWVNDRPTSSPRSEKPAEYGDVLCIVRRTSPHPFVSEPVKLTKKDLRFWIGMALWIGPPLLPLLVLIVFSIRDLHWQGPPATVGHHATAEAPAKLSNASSNGIGSADERHSKRNVPSTRRRSSALLEEISSTQRSPEPFFWSAERPGERWKRE